MPCTKRSTLSSALTAATAAVSSLSGLSSAPAATSTVMSSSTAIGVATGSPIPASSTLSASSIAVVASSAASATSTATATTSSSGNTTYAGVNIAGLDFGCGTDGTCTVDGVTFPSTGAAQMQHFSSSDNLNVFRLTVGWQYLTNAVIGGDLDATNFGQYNTLMSSCLAITGAKCIVDIHNYARWDGNIIGQSSSGPTNEQFAALWTSLATEYSNNTNVIFGIMNEPHDLTVSTWADTVQAAVTAIRAVAPDNMILMPGSSYSSAATLPTEAGPYLLNVTNPDGTTDNLMFDVHKYLDSDNSGTSTECVTNNIDDAFEPLATWLRTNNRQAMLSETGGGNTASCIQYVCEELAYLNENSDVFLGYVGWAAGAFDSTYALTLTPTGTTASSMVDTSLMSSCFAR
ncbi:hypothetical protein N0V82_007050 [Gnomoniopsis sp. IMI 355080]|nr:hypothetical protein N0V82_007050 [Gnomoniopsis sp. IMI 355080]